MLVLALILVRIVNVNSKRTNCYEACGIKGDKPQWCVLYGQSVMGFDEESIGHPAHGRVKAPVGMPGDNEGCIDLLVQGYGSVNVTDDRVFRLRGRLPCFFMAFGKGGSIKVGGGRDKNENIRPIQTLRVIEPGYCCHKDLCNKTSPEKPIGAGFLVLTIMLLLLCIVIGYMYSDMMLGDKKLKKNSSEPFQQC